MNNVSVHYDAWSDPRMAEFNSEYKEPTLEENIDFAKRRATIAKRGATIAKLNLEKNDEMSDMVSALMTKTYSQNREPVTLNEIAATLVKDRQHLKRQVVSADEHLNKLLNQQASTEA